MIYPKNNKIIHWFMDAYGRRLVNRNFHAINFNTVTVDKNKPVLLIANHFSIWDGIVLYWLNHKLFRKRFHVMLLEDTSKKEPFLKYAGAFSVQKKSRDVLESLDYAAKLLNDPENLVLIFPQGKLYSNFVNDVRFEKGVLKVIKQAGSDFQLVFAATFIENFQHKKPSANIYLKTGIHNNFINIDELQQAYQQHYHAAWLQQTQIVL